MAKRDNPTQSNAIAKANLEAALKNPSITDFRKEARVFTFRPSELEPEDVGEMCSALWTDYADGRITPQDVGVFLNILDRPITVADLNIRKEELQLKIEMRAKTGARIRARALAR